MLTILFDGIAYGMLLFVVACGLAVTLGLMNFVNLAHGAFAMAGGYITVILVNRLGLPFLASLPLAFVFTAAIGLVLERTLYVHVYGRTPLEQVLFTIGLVFMSVAAVDYVMGSQQQFVSIPSYLQGQINLFGIGIGRYRLLIIAVCGLLTVALQFALAKTRFGSRLRAAVDDARVARGLGINVNAVFAVTFAVGTGLAGLGGALGAEIMILALFALSLDLILGYAGIVSLGHAAFFGFGAYVAGILAKYGIIKEPVLALLVSGLAAMALGFVTSFLVLRGSDLTRLMVTLGVALVLREIANRLDITGGADGLQGIAMEPVLGHFAFDMFGRTAYVYSLIVL